MSVLDLLDILVYDYFLTRETHNWDRIKRTKESILVFQIWNIDDRHFTDYAFDLVELDCK